MRCLSTFTGFAAAVLLVAASSCAADPTLLWQGSFQSGRRATSLDSRQHHAVTDTMIYAAGSNEVTAFAIADGTNLWSITLNGTIGTGTVCALGVCVIGVADAWTPPPVNTPTVRGGRVQYNYYTGFNATTGARLWTVNRNQPFPGTIIVVGDTYAHVIAAHYDTEAFDLFTGESKWVKSTKAIAPKFAVLAHPITGEKCVVGTTFDGNIVAYTALNGTEVLDASESFWGQQGSAGVCTNAARDVVFATEQTSGSYTNPNYPWIAAYTNKGTKVFSTALKLSYSNSWMNMIANGPTCGRKNVYLTGSLIGLMAVSWTDGSVVWHHNDWSTANQQCEIDSDEMPWVDSAERVWVGCAVDSEYQGEKGHWNALALDGATGAVAYNFTLPKGDEDDFHVRTHTITMNGATVDLLIIEEPSKGDLFVYRL